MRPFAVRMHSAPVEDAFVYRTSLLCWTFDGSLRVYSIADIEEAVLRADPYHGDYINYGLFHTRGIGATANQSSAWRDSGDPKQSLQPIQIDADAIPHVTTRVALEADALLDLLIYYDTIFLATSSGMFSITDFEPLGSGDHLRPTLHVRDACYGASAGLGAVGASCGDEGLHLLLGVNETMDGVKPKLAAEQSLRSEIGYGSVVNHRNRSEYEFIDGITEDTKRGAILRGVRSAQVHSRPRARAYLLDVPDPDFVLWDHSRLVVFDDHGVSSISVVVRDRERSLNNVKRLGAYASGFGKVLSATKVERLFAVEGETAIGLVGRTDFHVLETGPVISLRSYPRSHRYKRMATATAESGLWLIGAED